MKKYILFLIMLFNFYNILAEAQETKWNIEKSSHFIVYYKNASADFIRELIDKSEGYYNKISDDLGFRRFDFWLWDKRAKIYVFDNAKDYQSGTGKPSWSVGCVSTQDKIIQTFPYAQGFFDATLPHEMSHIIFREFVGFDNHAIPLWLEEGVASYQEKLKYSMANIAIKKAINTGNFMTLGILSNFSPQFTTDNNAVYLFYAEAFSLVDFLIKEFGKDNFVLFCQALRDKKNLERAVASSYPFSSIQELDLAWQKYIKNEPR